MRGMQDATTGDAQELRVVVFQEDGYWVAQCIEYDIGAQGKTFRDMAMHFALTLGLDLDESLNRHGEPFAGIDPAPAYFEKMWEQRASTLKPIQETEEASPGYEMALVA